MDKTSKTIRNMAAKVASQPNLDSLFQCLNKIEEAAERIEMKLEDFVDLAGLPTFGGEEPLDTGGIFSWDETRYLVQSDETLSFVLESRAD